MPPFSVLTQVTHYTSEVSDYGKMLESTATSRVKHSPSKLTNVPLPIIWLFLIYKLTISLKYLGATVFENQFPTALKQTKISS